MAEEKKRPEAALHDSLPVIRNDAVVKQKEGSDRPTKGRRLHRPARTARQKLHTPKKSPRWMEPMRSHDNRTRAGTAIQASPYIIHPICVARILAEMGMDKESVIAALLHDVVEDTDETLADITAKFGKTIAHLVDGVTKLGKVPLSTKEDSRRRISAELPCSLRISA